MILVLEHPNPRPRLTAVPTTTDDVTVETVPWPMFPVRTRRDSCALSIHTWYRPL